MKIKLCLSIIVKMFISAVMTLSFASAAYAGQDSVATAQFIYQRLTGKKIRVDSPIVMEMAALIGANRHDDAARVATKDPSFTGVTARHFASLLLTSDKNPNLPLNDSLALIVGSIRDNRDARQLLTGDFIYAADERMALGRPQSGSNQLFDVMEASSRDLSLILKSYSPQWTVESLESSGLFTTRHWASVNYANGTNRRVIPAALEAFLCKPLQAWRRPNLPIDRIRQDIDRFPQGNARLFHQECRSCHAAMDGFAGAFAKIQFSAGTLTWSTDVEPKMVNNANVYPDGYITQDNTWINFLTDDVDDSFGWSMTGSESGSGIRAFATALATSRAFGECMTKRVIREICHHDLPMSNTFVRTTAAKFALDDFRLADLFRNVAVAPECR